MSDELIARLEKATGPDRELDAAIWELVDPQAFTVIKSHRRAFINRDWTPEEQAQKAAEKAKEYAPNYTSSIDAALTLVPEGFKWKLGYSRNVPCVAELIDYRENPLGRFDGECDSNHAIAICIAALKARAAP